MHKLATSNQQLENRRGSGIEILIPNSSLLISITCAQTVHEEVYRGGTTTAINHLAGYIYNASVHKRAAYTPQGLNFIPLKIGTYTQPYYRLKSVFIPTVHRPYKNKGKLNLDKYIIGGRL